MLPIKLKMCGFLSYLKETEIDFTKFGRKGLYLITGDTGAGKTTIFDAISYALYGKASGDKRDVRLFRSKNASIDDPTYVELTFMSGGRKYTVRRNPEYEQRAKRGTGTSVCKPKVLLTEYDGGREAVRELKSEKKTGEKDPITEIIGIDSEKFRQLSMIAQGDFDRVITADTKQRTAILRAIFNTEKYERLQTELACAAAGYEKECSELAAGMNDKLMSAACAEESRFREKLDEQKKLCSDRKYSMPAQEITALLKEIIEEDKSYETALRERMGDLEKRLAEINREIGTAQERETKRKKYLAAKASLESAEKLLPQRKAGFDASSGNKEKASQLMTKKKLLEEKRPLYSELSAHISQLAQIMARQKSNEENLKTATASLAAQTQLLDKQKKEIGELKNTENELVRLEFGITENETRRDRLRDALRLIQKYKNAALLAEKTAERLDASRAEAFRLRSEYIRVYEAYINEQAGYLAESLEAGKPCPVCGSLTHPSKAVKAENAPSRNEVEAARTKSTEADKQAASNAAQLKAANDNRDELKISTDELSEEMFGDKRDVQELERAVTESGIALKEQISRQTAERDELRKKLERKNRLEAGLPEAEKKYDNIKQQLSDCNTASAVYEQRIENEKQNIGQIKASLPYETAELLEKNIAEHDISSKRLLQSYEEAEKALNDCNNEISRQKAALEALGEVSAESQEELLKKLGEEAEKLHNMNSSLNEGLIKLSGRISTNTAAVKYIEDHASELAKKREYYIQANELSQTANGRLTDGQEKLNLEVYAQARYFDGILALSNIRLMKMSNNKYEFRRSEESLSRRGQFGLEIDVIDHDSATRRSVRSLSGGESFMASLSLALGFSDTIQTTVGGVRLETIFIDEGFGTLDGGKLANAYGVFNELGTAGKCLVGIISHVDELKKRIPHRIEITKDAAGNSHAEVRTDI